MQTLLTYQRMTILLKQNSEEQTKNSPYEKIHVNMSLTYKRTDRMLRRCTWQGLCTTVPVTIQKQGVKMIEYKQTQSNTMITKM